MLRYYNVIGPRQSYNQDGGVVPIFIKNMLLNQPLVIEGDGTQTRCFTSVHDVVRANILACERCTNYGHVFNIGTQEITSINDLARMIAPNVKPEHAPPRVGDIHEFQPNIKKAKLDFGYTPSLKLKDMIPEIVDWLKGEIVG
jgi:UDP-glucose 4-epimerase